jgi:group I intron endonuclease
MFYVYIIESSVTNKYYIGYTNNYINRWNTHKHFSEMRKTKLYSHIRKHGIENFEMILIDSFEDKHKAIQLEKDLISLDDCDCLNLAPGGEGGFVVRNKNDWRKKLSKARSGRKPALGMSHTEENKKKFSEVSNEYWNTQMTYSAKDVARLSFKDAHKLYGISKTHYYRLLKRVKANDLD